MSTCAIQVDMLLRIDMDGADPVWRQIADQIRSLLVSGRLRPGARLATVRELAVDLGVNHNTVAEAYRRLVHWNWRGEIDHTVARSVPGAALPLLLGASVCLMMLGMQIGIRHGAPRAPTRASMLKVLLAGEFFVAFICCGILASTVTGG